MMKKKCLIKFDLYRLHLTEQDQILNDMVDEVKGIEWYTADGPGPGAVGTAGMRGPRIWNYFKFPYGLELAVRSMQQLRPDLEVCTLIGIVICRNLSICQSLMFCIHF